MTNILQKDSKQCKNTHCFNACDTYTLKSLFKETNPHGRPNRTTRKNALSFATLSGTQPLKTSIGTINNVKKGFNAFSLYFTLEFVNSAKH